MVYYTNFNNYKIFICKYTHFQKILKNPSHNKMMLLNLHFIILFQKKLLEKVMNFQLLGLFC